MINDPNGIAGLFLKYDYAETKDLAKAFLTLNSAILAFSVTFSEKIVDLKNANAYSKIAIGISWIANVFAIIFCGVAICYISLAGGQAVYGGDYNYYAQVSYIFLLLAGASFVFGLMALVCSAIIALARAPSSPQNSN